VGDAPPEHQVTVDEQSNGDETNGVRGLQTREITHRVFKVEFADSAETCLIRLRGELDLDSAPVLDGEIDRVIAAAARPITIDLADLEFIDSTGLRCLLRAQRLSESNGVPMELLSPTGQVDLVLRLTGLRKVLTIVR
jgi:anti-sigma B factor antagonist